MNFSIITAVYNNSGTIGSAISSVTSQTYPDIEYIVIDGNSNDGTDAIVRQNSARVHTYIREPDKGMYDALNKGIRHATGDIIGFLHSDDVYADCRVIEKVAQVFADSNIEIVYGDLKYVKRNDIQKVVRHWKAQQFSPNLLRQGWMPPHPTLFVRRECYEKYGLFNLEYKIGADYEFILRMFTQGPVTAAYLPEVLVLMRLGGMSNKNLKNMIIKSLDDYRALTAHSQGGLLTLLRKNLSKISQFRRR